MSRDETLADFGSPIYKGDEKIIMPELTPLIPGIYADEEGHICVDMEEFLVTHGLPDAPELRKVIWSEISDVFAGFSIFELE